MKFPILQFQSLVVFVKVIGSNSTGSARHGIGSTPPRISRPSIYATYGWRLSTSHATAIGSISLNLISTVEPGGSAPTLGKSITAAAIKTKVAIFSESVSPVKLRTTIVPLVSVSTVTEVVGAVRWSGGVESVSFPSTACALPRACRTLHSAIASARGSTWWSTTSLRYSESL